MKELPQEALAVFEGHQARVVNPKLELLAYLL